MDKLNLGDDFTGEDDAPAGEEAIEKEEGDEGGEEGGEEGDGEEGSAEDDGEKPKSDKEKELQGLIDQEKELDGDLSTIDAQIKAAKDRIIEKRRARREGRDLAGKVDETIPAEDGESDDLADIDPETIKVLERFTKAKGLVPMSEIGKMTYNQAHKTSEDNFYQVHKEYLPENDDGDLLYNALKEELSYFAAPKDPKKIPELFEKAHKHVMEKYPDKFKTIPKKVVTQEVKKSSAIVKKQGVGGGNAGGTGAGTRKNGNDGGSKTYSDKQIQALRDGGWSDDEIKELTS